jgi:uncharacterized integral membrane protein
VRIVFWVVVALLAIAFGVFAVNNFHTAELSLWPFVERAIGIPVFVLVLAAGLVGFLAGGIVTWFGMGRLRRLTRARRRALKQAQAQIAAARRALPAPGAKT